MCVTLSGGETVDVDPLPQAGSDRRYFRLSYGDRSCIGAYVPDANEGECFVKLAECFRSYGCNVPNIYAVSHDFHYYLQEDLGDLSLFSSLKDENLEQLVMQTLDRLVKLQKTPEEIWKKECVCKDFCRRQVMWDLNYFKYEYVKPANVIFNEDLLENDLEKLADRLISIPRLLWGFMMRDCQSRNVMVTRRGPFFIDFQGGRFGPSLYDAVSLLWQARAGFSPGFRDKMLDYYTDRYCGGDPELKKEMLRSLGDVVLFRTLQVLGAYGFRGLVQHRSHFLLSIPAALSNLNELLEKDVIKCYPELANLASKLVAGLQTKGIVKESGLTV
ncbi:MAG: phosphotransferase, partial [Muribaculaceae bacterium]|nr:phosphotransferase [Muribaculaceae bacterium]